MKPNYKILIKENHPCAVEVPVEFEKIKEAPFGFESNVKALEGLADTCYEKLLQLAKDNAVRFKDIQKVMFEVFSRTGIHNTEDKLYDCPEGFEIVVESGLKDPCPQCGCTSRQQARGECTVSWCYRGEEGYLKQYATLKPLDAK